MATSHQTRYFSPTSYNLFFVSFFFFLLLFLFLLILFVEHSPLQPVGAGESPLGPRKRPANCCERCSRRCHQSGSVGRQPRSPRTPRSQAFLHKVSLPLSSLSIYLSPSLLLSLSPSLPLSSILSPSPSPSLPGKYLFFSGPKIARRSEVSSTLIHATDQQLNSSNSILLLEPSRMHREAKRSEEKRREEKRREEKRRERERERERKEKKRKLIQNIDHN